MGKPSKKPTNVKRILDAYVAGKTDFEEARDQLHTLPPEAMRDVLALAGSAPPGARGLLVMVLSDVLYPPALPAMRAWLDDEDVESVVMPAISALDRAAGGAFKSDRMWRASGLVPQLRAEIVAWWDTGAARPSVDEEAWLAQQHAKRGKDTADLPPPSPALTATERRALYDDLVALRKAMDALDSALAWRLDVEAIGRVLTIYDRHATDGHVLQDALEAAARGVAAPADVQERISEMVGRANKAAGWSKAHGRYRDPAAKAAANVAQGVWYAVSSLRANRLQGMHHARDAIEYAGGRLPAVRAELDWQLAQVRAAGA